MAKNRKSLKTALNSHQIKMFKQKQTKAVEAVSKSKLASVVTKVKDAKGSKNRANKGHKVKTIVPYSAWDSILLVGEGDFSFAHSLIEDHGLNPRNLTATALDSEPMCLEKYPWSKNIIAYLQEKGVKTLFRVDATKLESCKELKGRKFNKVVFNFPHTGKGITDQDRNILSNQELVLGFLKSAASKLAEGKSNVQLAKKKHKNDESSGDEHTDDDEAVSSTDALKTNNKQSSPTRGIVLITLRQTPPYTLWDVPKLAKKPPDSNNPRYTQIRSFAFRLSDYPHYTHRRTAGHRGDREIPVLKESDDGITDTRTWEFELAE